jgi:hypothetical protein
MFLFIKIFISIILIFLWFRECRKEPISSFGNYFFILFIFTLIYDIFALNHKMITLTEKPFNLIHLILDRNILLPMSLFFIQRIYQSALKKFLFSMVWIAMFYILENINEQFHIVKLKNWTLFKWGYIGGIIIILSLIMSVSLQKLARSRMNNAPSN